MKSVDKDRIGKRMLYVGGIFLIGFFLIIGKAFWVQIIKGKQLKEKAEKDYIRIETISAKRGTIFDRNNKPLAISIDTKSIYARPYMIANKKKVACILARLTHQPVKDVYNRLKKDSPFVWIRRQIPDEWANRILEKRIKGIGAVDEIRRYYPAKEIGAHVIGFVNIDGKGLEGVERRYNKVLSGKRLSIFEIKDALKRPLVIKNLSNSAAKNIVLTIDREIQFKAQRVLEKTVKKSHAKSGQCIVMDPYTGEILAMAVYPEFNPNIFYKYKPSFLRNRAITDCYEPGSVIKPFLVAAALEEGVVTPNTLFYCEEGSYRIAGHVIHDTHKYGWLTVSQIIKVSSNIGAVKIGERLGYHKFCKYLRKFGFGERTGIDLIGERTGWIREVGDDRPVDQATMFFGQGLSVTSIQLATAMAAIANGGLLLRPYVVKEIRDKKGNVLEETRPYVKRRVISERTADEVKKMLELVVGSGGTAPTARIEGFEVAGKTGTAQKIDPKTGKYSNTRYIATFVGFVPVKRPKLLILVVIDEPKGIYYAGLVAAPAFKEIAKWSLAYLGISPEKKEKMFFVKNLNKNKQKSLKYNLLKENELPDLTGMSMRDVIRIADKYKLGLRMKGYGYAVKQYPAPGTPLNKVKELIVYFKGPDR